MAVAPSSREGASFVEPVAHDHNGDRLELIDLVVHDTTVQMTLPQAQTGARLLLRSAELRELPSQGACPPWCLRHDDHPDPGTDELVHYGPDTSIPVYGPRTSDSHFRVRLSAADTAEGRESYLDLFLDGIATILTAAEARRVAEEIIAKYRLLTHSGD